MKCSRHVAKPEWHLLEGEGTIRACEGSFLLILRRDGDLIVPGIAVEESIILVSGEMIKHLVDEGKWKMVFQGGVVELLIVHANSEPGHRAGGDKLVVVVLDHRHSALLWNTLHRTR